jgi:hypothetical protein
MRRAFAQRTLPVVGLSIVLILGASRAAAQSAEEVSRIGRAAYVYGYPLVTMELTRRVMTNTASVSDKAAPMGQFRNLRTYPDAAFRAVTAPNADTLYSTAWLDLTKEPYILSLPDEEGRYYLMPMLSGWTDVFASPGKRTTGTGAQKFAITGPGWQGDLPDGVKQIEAPTNMVWILGRTYCTGTAEDYSAVHALQAQYELVPLSAYGKTYTPPKGKVGPKIDMQTAVRDQVNRLPASEYFALLAELMKSNPPAAADGPMAGPSARRRARTAPTTCSAQRSRRLAWARTCRKTRSIRSGASTPTASRWMARTNTSCTSHKISSRRRRRSGR